MLRVCERECKREPDREKKRAEVWEVEDGRADKTGERSQNKANREQVMQHEQRQQSSGSQSVWMWAERGEHCGDLSPLSGRCLNKGARRAASVDPSSSTGQERSSWSICNTQQLSFEQLYREMQKNSRATAQGLFHIQHSLDVIIMWHIYLLLVGPVESTSDCNLGKKPCS